MPEPVEPAKLEDDLGAMKGLSGSKVAADELDNCPAPPLPSPLADGQAIEEECKAALAAHGLGDAEETLLPAMVAAVRGARASVVRTPLDVNELARSIAAARDEPPYVPKGSTADVDVGPSLACAFGAALAQHTVGKRKDNRPGCPEITPSLTKSAKGEHWERGSSSERDADADMRMLSWWWSDGGSYLPVTDLAAARGPPSDAERDALRDAQGDFPELTLLPNHHRLKFLLAPSALDIFAVANDKGDPEEEDAGGMTLAKLAGWIAGIGCLVVKDVGGDEGNKCVVAVRTQINKRAVNLGNKQYSDAGAAEFTLHDPLELDAWGAGAALWFRELISRVKVSARHKLWDIISKIEKAKLEDPPLEAPLARASGEDGVSLALLRLAARIHFTHLVDEKEGGIAEAKQWVAAEEVALSDIFEGGDDAKKMERARAQCMIMLIKEFTQTVAAVEEHFGKGGSGKPLQELGELRAVRAGDSVRLCINVDGSDCQHEYGFQLQVNSNPLLVTESTREHRRCVFQELASGRGGIVFMNGRAGTGKTEMTADLAGELGRRHVEFGNDMWKMGMAQGFGNVMERLAQFFGSAEALRGAQGTFFTLSDPPDELLAGRQGEFASVVSIYRRGSTAAVRRRSTAAHDDPEKPAHDGAARMPCCLTISYTSNPNWDEATKRIPPCLAALGVEKLSSLPDPGTWRRFAHATWMEMPTERPVWEKLFPVWLSQNGVRDPAGEVLNAWFGARNDLAPWRMPDVAQAVFKRAGKWQREGAGPLACFAGAVSGWNALAAHRDDLDSARGPECATVLTAVMESAPGGAEWAEDVVRDAIKARLRAAGIQCRDNPPAGASRMWSVRRRTYTACASELGFGPGSNHGCGVAFAFSAMDIAMLAHFFPRVAVELLTNKLGQLDDEFWTEPLRDGGGKVLATQDAAGLDALLPAALLIDDDALRADVLGTPFFLTLVRAKFNALRPLFFMETFCLAALYAFYVAWAYGEAWAAWPAVALAACFGTAELLQFWAALHPVFGVVDQVMDHVTDPYNLIDVVVSVLVFVSTLGAWDNRSGKAVTVFFLTCKVITQLRTFTSFGFLVKMITLSAWMMRNFALLCVIIMFGIATCFDLLQRLPPSEAADDELDNMWSHRLWGTYLLTMLGDFEADTYTVAPAAQVFFIVVTLAVNIVMLNLLIAIVGEAYGLAQSMNIELSRISRAGTVVDLENVYLRPFSTSVTRRGYPCRLLHYPACLAGGPQLVLTQKKAKEQDSDDKNWEETERMLVRRIGEDTKQSLERVEDHLMGVMRKQEAAEARIAHHGHHPFAGAPFAGAGKALTDALLQKHGTRISGVDAGELTKLFEDVLADHQ